MPRASSLDERSPASPFRGGAHEQALLAELADAVGPGLLVKICRRILQAERDHPVFATDFEGAVKEVKSELLEWESKAIVGRREDSEEEAFDGIVTLFRFVRRDYEDVPHHP